MKFLFFIYLFLTQCWSGNALDQNIHVSDEYQRRVQEVEVESDIPVDDPVSYDCRFINRWTIDRHPILFPQPGEFWNRPYMTSHNDLYNLWSGDQLASRSVKSYTRSGNTRPLQLEAFAAGTSVNSIVKSITYTPSGDFDAVGMEGRLNLDSEHRLISAIARMNPSPDWFSGLDSFSPVMNGMWLSSFTLDSFPWDAGVVDGITYSSVNNDNTIPKGNIIRYTFDTVPPNGIFLNANKNEVLPVAQWSCDLAFTTSPSTINQRVGPTASPTINGEPTFPPTVIDVFTPVPDIELPCFEGRNTKFFRWNPNMMAIVKPRPQNCLWLAGQILKIQRRHCNRGRNFGPQPVDETPLAKEACRVTCGTCPP